MSSDVHDGSANLFLRYSSQANNARYLHTSSFTKDLMKKFNMDELNPVSTLMSTAASLDPYENCEVVDQREYRTMIGSCL
jgi:hypothetical protein